MKKRHLLLTMLLLMTVALFTPDIYATTTNQQNTDIIVNTTLYNTENIANNEITEYNQSTTASNNDEAVSDTVNNSIQNQNYINTITSNNSNQNQNTKNIQYAFAAAGDETFSNVQNNWFTTKNITEAAGRVNKYIQTYHKLPKYVTIGNNQLSMPQFLKLLTTGLIQINKGKTSSINIKSVNTPTNIIENVKSGSITKTEYLDMAVRIQSYINSNGRAPNYATSSLGNIGYPSLIYMYSRILSYYDDNNVLEKSATMKPWGSVINQTSGNKTSQDGFTIAQISAAAGVVKSYVEANKKLPSTVTINGKQVTMPQFLQLLNTSLIQIYSKKTTTISLKTAGSPSNPTEDVKSGNIYKSEYLDLANRIANYLNSNGKAPNYASSTLGKIRYETLIYLESRILNFHAQNQVLPNYASVNTWKTSASSIKYPEYLKATLNCPSTNQNIVNLAKSITASKTTDYAKATAIFNWVNDHTTYAFYYNSDKGALGTLSSGSANCCDTTHLLIALTRAAGIPARYQHGICKFSDGIFGHVWAQVYVNDQWYYADAISPRNGFGVINNWDTSNWTLVGIYAELPF